MDFLSNGGTIFAIHILKLTIFCFSWFLIASLWFKASTSDSYRAIFLVKMFILSLERRLTKLVGTRTCNSYHYFFKLAAKNLILAGVKSVTLHDEGTVELWDMSSNFIFSEEDLGKNRALASFQKLQELNNAVAVSTLTTKLAKDQLSDFQVIFFIIKMCRDRIKVTVGCIYFNYLHEMFDSLLPAFSIYTVCLMVFHWVT